DINSRHFGSKEDKEFTAEYAQLRKKQSEIAFMYKSFHTKVRKILDLTKHQSSGAIPEYLERLLVQIDFNDYHLNSNNNGAVQELPIQPPLFVSVVNEIKNKGKHKDTSLYQFDGRRKQSLATSSVDGADEKEKGNPLLKKRFSNSMALPRKKIEDKVSGISLSSSNNNSRPSSRGSSCNEKDKPFDKQSNGNVNSNANGNANGNANMPQFTFDSATLLINKTMSNTDNNAKRTFSTTSKLTSDINSTSHDRLTNETLSKLDNLCSFFYYYFFFFIFLKINIKKKNIPGRREMDKDRKKNPSSSGRNLMETPIGPSSMELLLKQAKELSQQTQTKRDIQSNQGARDTIEQKKDETKWERNQSVDIGKLLNNQFPASKVFFFFFFCLHFKCTPPFFFYICIYKVGHDKYPDLGLFECPSEKKKGGLHVQLLFVCFGGLDLICCEQKRSRSSSPPALFHPNLVTFDMNADKAAANDPNAFKKEFDAAMKDLSPITYPAGNPVLVDNAKMAPLSLHDNRGLVTDFKTNPASGSDGNVWPNKFTPTPLLNLQNKAKPFLDK
ncbi:hypothetical protein RFI_18319, partial [Reticulomyxa filosa]